MEFERNITIGFDYENHRYVRRIEKCEIKKDEDTWYYYFDQNRLHFEVWGGLDDDGEPATGGDNAKGGIPFAVNVYEFVSGEGDQIDQIDDIDVMDVDSDFDASIEFLNKLLTERFSLFHSDLITRAITDRRINKYDLVKGILEITESMSAFGPDEFTPKVFENV